MTRRFYTASYAESLIKRAGDKWRPSNGAEGHLFRERWCDQCQRNTPGDGAFVDGGDYCSIIGLTMALDVTDPEYPVEWQYRCDGQPCCTAFVELGQPIPAVERCPRTVDMFGNNTLEER